MVKFPKVVRRYCRFCRKHTKQTVKLITPGRARGALKRGAVERARRRGLARGYGGYGRWPPTKPPISRWKRKVKAVKKINLLFTCTECKKSTSRRTSLRAGKISLK